MVASGIKLRTVWWSVMGVEAAARTDREVDRGNNDGERCWSVVGVAGS